MPQADAIQTMMFRIPEDVDLSGTLYSASLPEEWHRLFEAIWPRKNRRPQIPYGTLGASLRLLFPQLAHIESMNSYKMTRGGWLHSWEIPGPEPFMALVQEWLRLLGADGQTGVVIEQLNCTDLVWDVQKLGFDQYSASDNGTPDLGSLHYSALPDLLCAELAEREIGIGDQAPLTFRRAYYGRTPSLISWPPNSDLRSRASWYWSYVLTPRIVTFPGHSEPFLSISPSVRRWASKPLKRDSRWYDLSYRDATSVYVEVDDPWMSTRTDDRATSLVGLPLGLRTTREENLTVSRPIWNTPVDRVLKGIMTDPELPDPVELTDDPTRFIHRDRGSIGITMRVQNTTHRVGVGTPLADRRDIYHSVSKILDPHGFTPAGQSRRIQIPVARKTSLLRGSKYTEIPGARIVDSIQRSLGDRIMIELLHQTEATRSALRAELWRRLLKGQPSEDPPHGDQTTINGVDIQVSFRELGAIGSRLDDPERAAEERRVEEVAVSLEDTDIPIGCLVELQGEDYFSWGDPKRAIRRGLAMTGRLSQFKTPIPEADADAVGGAMSVRSAVADLLRQLGNMPDAPFDMQRSGFPDDVQAMGVWVIKDLNTPQLPILVHLASRSQVAKGEIPIRVMLPTGSRRGEWYSYPRAQAAIASGKISDIRGDDMGAVLKRMLGEVAGSVEVDGVPLLMLCDTDNLRRVWPELQNGNLVVGQNANMPWNAGGLMPRMVRVNTSDREVPQWFEESLSWPSGVFGAPGSQSYFSLAAKPATMSSIRWKESKRDRPFNRHASTRICEVVLVQLHEDDDPAAWAGAVHRLREMAPHFNDPVQLPLPLHLAKLTEQYMPPPSNRRGGQRRRG